jgi:hypothetical protein
MCEKTKIEGADLILLHEACESDKKDSVLSDEQKKKVAAIAAQRGNE